jgi:hypothetical protein
MKKQVNKIEYARVIDKQLTERISLLRRHLRMLNNLDTGRQETDILLRKQHIRRMLYNESFGVGKTKQIQLKQVVGVKQDVRAIANFNRNSGIVAKMQVLCYSLTRETGIECEAKLDPKTFILNIWIIPSKAKNYDVSNHKISIDIDLTDSSFLVKKRAEVITQQINCMIVKFSDHES